MRYLFRSKALHRSMSILALHSDKEFDIDELASFAGVTSVATRQAMKYLVADGLVSQRSVGRRWLYRAEPNHPYFPELRSIAVKSFGGQDEVRKSITSDADVLIAAIFGSFARGEERPESDIDILFVVADEDAEETDFRLATTMAGVSVRIARQVNPSIYSLSQFRGLMAEQNQALAEILKGPLVLLKGELPGA
jgi:predicted nucleotidyltransferase